MIGEFQIARELVIPKNSQLAAGIVAIDALWKYYAQETYSYLQQIKLSDKYDNTLSIFLIELDSLVQRSVENRYRIYLPEEKLWRKKDNLSEQYKELVERIRVHNASIPFLQSFIFDRKADEIVVQLFKDAKVIADQVSSKKIKVECLGELLWMEVLLIVTWDYIGIKKKKFKKMDRYLKQYIFEYADSEKLDEHTRGLVKWDYSEKSFELLDSLEFRIIESFDTTWKLLAKLVRRLFGRGKSEREKKLE